MVYLPIAPCKRKSKHKEKGSSEKFHRKKYNHFRDNDFYKKGKKSRSTSKHGNSTPKAYIYIYIYKQRSLVKVYEVLLYDALILHLILFFFFYLFSLRLFYFILLFFYCYLEVHVNLFFYYLINLSLIV